MKERTAGELRDSVGQFNTEVLGKEWGTERISDEPVAERMTAGFLSGTLQTVKHIVSGGEKSTRGGRGGKNQST